MVKINEILSESSYYTVKEIFKDGKVRVEDDNGNSITMNANYMTLLSSADEFTSEEKKTKTELAEIFLNNARVAMTAAYLKQDSPKTKKDQAAERQKKIEELKAKALKVPLDILLEEALTTTIEDTVPGGLRIIKGRHYGNPDNNGRVNFVDMELPKGNKGYDDRLRLVDMRSLQWLIVDKVKYTLK